MSDLLLAEFDSRKAVEDAVRAAAEAGHSPQDVLSPSPIEGIEDHLTAPRHWGPIGWVMVVAGALGAALAYFMQWYSAVFAYPTNSGGRPLDSWPAYLLVPYEVAILSASVVGLLAWMWMCGLPKLFHPLFSAHVTERAVQDRYVVVFPYRDDLIRWIEAHLHPTNLYEVHE